MISMIIIAIMNIQVQKLEFRCRFRRSLDEQ